MQQLDPRTDRGLLERCGKLLSSIHAFTRGDASGADQQPSPVSVLDAAAFLADEDSPSALSASKRAIDFRSSSVGHPKPASAVSDPAHDEYVDPEASGCPDPDYAYVAELVRHLGGARARARDPAAAYRAAEQRRRERGGDPDTWHLRRLLCGAVTEALERQRSACPWEPAAWLRGAELVGHVWAEVRRAGEPVAPAADADLNDVTCRAIRRDLAADGGSPWGSLRQRPRHGADVADAVLQIERLLFVDLVADTIRELADADRPLPRRKLVF
jgi:hypothetical protein